MNKGIIDNRSVGGLAMKKEEFDMDFWVFPILGAFIGYIIYKATGSEGSSGVCILLGMIVGYMAFGFRVLSYYLYNSKNSTKQK